MLFLSGIAESKGMLVGCNQGVMSVDFDSNCTHIICASNDFASRVWTVADQRLRVSKASFWVMVCLWIYSVFCIKFFIKLIFNTNDKLIKIVVLYCFCFTYFSPWNPLVLGLKLLKSQFVNMFAQVKNKAWQYTIF